jgi:AcrR family transcriptional regulator
MGKRIEGKKEEKEKNIIAASLRLFSEQSFRNTTIDEIAKEAGVAKGTVYLYFKDKDAIFRHIISLVSQIQQERQAEILEIDGWEAKLRHYILTQCQFFKENAYLARISVLEIHGLDQGASDIFFNALTRHASILTAILRGGSRDNVFDVPEPEKAGRALLGMINYYLIQEILHPTNQDEVSATEFLYNLAMHGLKNRH